MLSEVGKITLFLTFMLQRWHTQSFTTSIKRRSAEDGDYFFYLICYYRFIPGRKKSLASTKTLTAVSSRKGGCYENTG
jgi:hypothetical protein